MASAAAKRVGSLHERDTRVTFEDVAGIDEAKTSWSRSSTS